MVTERDRERESVLRFALKTTENELQLLSYFSRAAHKTNSCKGNFSRGSPNCQHLTFNRKTSHPLSMLPHSAFWSRETVTPPKCTGATSRNSMLICILYQVLWSSASAGIKSSAPQIPRTWLKLWAELLLRALCVEGSLAGETCAHCSKSAKSAKEPFGTSQTAAHLVWQFQGDLTHRLKYFGRRTERLTKVLDRSSWRD